MAINTGTAVYLTGTAVYRLTRYSTDHLRARQDSTPPTRGSRSPVRYRYRPPSTRKPRKSANGQRRASGPRTGPTSCRSRGPVTAAPADGPGPSRDRWQAKGTASIPSIGGDVEPPPCPVARSPRVSAPVGAIDGRGRTSSVMGAPPAPSASVYGTCGARMRPLRAGRVRGNEHGIRRVRSGPCMGPQLTVRSRPVLWRRELTGRARRRSGSLSCAPG